jgi:hypothetical protein
MTPGKLDKSRAKELVMDYISTGRAGIIPQIAGYDKMDIVTLIERLARAIAIGR